MVPQLAADPPLEVVACFTGVIGETPLSPESAEVEPVLPNSANATVSRASSNLGDPVSKELAADWPHRTCCHYNWLKLEFNTMIHKEVENSFLQFYC